MKKKDLTEKLKAELLSKNMEEFEKAIDFTEEDWHAIKRGLSRREANMKAVLYEKAPDFSAIQLTPEGEITDLKVSLSDFKGNILALVLGSYTCPVFRNHNQPINRIYEAFKDTVSFLHIYVYEMHSVTDWFIPINLADNIIYDQPKTKAERSFIIKDWIKAKNIKMPVAMDDLDNTIDSAYAGSPERLYVIDKEGIIQFRSSEGPFDDREVDEWEKTLQRILKNQP
jgi:hypothetical protein